jgi:hypothetical protein
MTFKALTITVLAFLLAVGGMTSDVFANNVASNHSSTSNTSNIHEQLVNKIIQQAEEGKVITSEVALGSSRSQILKFHGRNMLARLDGPILSYYDLIFLLFDSKNQPSNIVSGIMAIKEFGLTVPEVKDVFRKAHSDWKLEFEKDPEDFNYRIEYKHKNGIKISFSFSSPLGENRRLIAYEIGLIQK